MSRIASAVFALSLGLTGISNAAVSTFAGTDAGDSNFVNNYGTSGYDIFDSSLGAFEANPAGLQISVSAPSLYGGNSSYAQLEPPGGGGLIESGVAYYAGASTGQQLSYVSLTFTATESYVLGIYTDNADRAGISPSSLEVVQTSGSGSGSSGFIADTLSSRGNLFLFDISGNAGDVLTIDGIAASNDSSGIGAITFATATPEPGTVSLLLAGAAGLVWRRRRKTA